MLFGLGVAETLVRRARPLYPRFEVEWLNTTGARQYRHNGMATLDDAIALASALPEVTEGARYGNRTWSVGKKAFAWERPFSKADIKRFGDATPPDGPILAVRTEDLHEKEALLEAQHRGVFTIEHFNAYPAVLIQLKTVTKKVLREVIVDGWLACAPPKVATEYLARGRTGGGPRTSSTRRR